MQFKKQFYVKKQHTYEISQGLGLDIFSLRISGVILQNTKYAIIGKWLIIGL